MLAVSAESKRDGRGLRERLALTFPLLSDPLATTIKQYGFYDKGNQTAWPALVLIDRRGRVRWRHITDTYIKRLTTDEVLKRIGAIPKT